MFNEIYPLTHSVRPQADVAAMKQAGNVIAPLPHPQALQTPAPPPMVMGPRAPFAGFPGQPPHQPGVIPQYPGYHPLLNSAMAASQNPVTPDGRFRTPGAPTPGFMVGPRMPALGKYSMQSGLKTGGGEEDEEDDEIVDSGEDLSAFYEYYDADQSHTQFFTPPDASAHVQVWFS